MCVSSCFIGCFSLESVSHRSVWPTSKAPQPQCPTTNHHPRCDPETGSSFNYGFISIPETLGAGCNGGWGGGAIRSPAEVHLRWGSGPGQGGTSWTRPPRQSTQRAQTQSPGRPTDQSSRTEGITSAWPVSGTEEEPEKESPAHSCLSTADQDSDLDSKREQQPSGGWERKAGGSSGRGCEDGVFFTVRWETDRASTQSYTD